jgi:hypothetical protein
MCDLKEKVFKPLRIDDKTRPNYISVANDIFNDIIHPLDIETIIKLVRLKIYHRYSIQLHV